MPKPFEDGENERERARRAQIAALDKLEAELAAEGIRREPICGPDELVVYITIPAPDDELEGRDA